MHSQQHLVVADLRQRDLIQTPDVSEPYASCTMARIVVGVADMVRPPPGSLLRVAIRASICTTRSRCPVAAGQMRFGSLCDTHALDPPLPCCVAVRREHLLNG